jgi:2-polyprenyl-3-methyl-5-hydroxy-6-metoxy-1,4-benzoquinol methylase
VRQKNNNHHHLSCSYISPFYDDYASGCRISHLDFLREYVKGKTVLDVGCVEHEASEFWVHRRLTESARSVLRIDVLEKDVEELQRRGYNIICADAMNDWLAQTFDAIVVGEVIEHVVNPGAFWPTCSAI